MDDFSERSTSAVDGSEERPLFDLSEAGGESSVSRLSAPQLVERIIAINPSATAGFLSRFRPDHLRNYLEHLTLEHAPRGRQGPTWIRRGDSRAIMVSETAD